MPEARLQRTREAYRGLADHDEGGQPRAIEVCRFFTPEFIECMTRLQRVATVDRGAPQADGDGR